MIENGHGVDVDTSFLFEAIENVHSSYDHSDGPEIATDFSRSLDILLGVLLEVDACYKIEVDVSGVAQRYHCCSLMAVAQLTYVRLQTLALHHCFD